jgi:hypothetical protein
VPPSAGPSLAPLDTGSLLLEGLGSWLVGSGATSGVKLRTTVAKETVERCEVDRCGDVDRVQRSERRLGKCSGRKEYRSVEGRQGDRIDEFSGTGYQDVQIQTRIQSHSRSTRRRVAA